MVLCRNLYASTIEMQLPLLESLSSVDILECLILYLTIKLVNLQYSKVQYLEFILLQIFIINSANFDFPTELVCRLEFYRARFCANCRHVFIALLGGRNSTRYSDENQMNVKVKLGGGKKRRTLSKRAHINLMRVISILIKSIYPSSHLST